MFVSVFLFFCSGIDGDCDCTILVVLSIIWFSTIALTKACSKYTDTCKFILWSSMSRPMPSYIAILYFDWQMLNFGTTQVNPRQERVFKTQDNSGGFENPWQ